MESNNNISLRIKAIRTRLGMTQDKFAELIGYSQGQVSDAEKGRIPISDKFIRLICSETGASEEYIRAGEGEMFTGNEPAPPTRPRDLLYEIEAAAEYKSDVASDPINDEKFEELRDLLWKAKDVLLSKTHYAQSLAANIRSFHMGVELDQDLKQRIVALEKNRGNIRGGDPPEKKDELLKMRTG